MQSCITILCRERCSTHRYRCALVASALWLSEAAERVGHVCGSAAWPSFEIQLGNHSGSWAQGSIMFKAGVQHPLQRALMTHLEYVAHSR